MKKFSTLVLGGIFLMSFGALSGASEKDKGSMAVEEKEAKAITASLEVKIVDKESMEEKGSMNEASKEKGSMKDADSGEWGVPHIARTLIKATQLDSTLSGTVDFVETGGGIQVVATLLNVTPAGKHGIHIHENGNCEDGGKAAGGHFNPAGTKHGFLPKDGHDNAHTGDMGNIDIDDNGNGILVVFLPGLSLSKGEKNISGKAVILHAKEDNFGQPTGNAGGRIGCGEIILNK